MSVLYVVATPIGNLADITLRALETFKAVDCIIAEDTRVIRRLLAHHGIAAPRLLKFTEYDTQRIPAILREITGKKTALTVDAGTPAISDPGALLVTAAREAGFAIYALPGPSALAAALSIAGVRSSQFRFVGFLPRKRGGFTRLLEEARQARIALVCYESPYRIAKTLEFLSEQYPEMRTFCAKELTKIHEESRWGEPRELLEWLSHPGKRRGEFVLIFDFSRKAGS